MQHQIVITLNPEEYREIQRLAKMAGTTSIGQFLHTRLLTFLGMRSSNRRFDTTYDTEKTVDLTQLGDTITRMHKELKQLLENGEISGYVTGTAPVEDIRENFISFKFETILQNDYNAVPSQPVYLSAETVFSELGVTLPKGADADAELTSALSFDSLPPLSDGNETTISQQVAQTEINTDLDQKPAPEPVPAQKLETEKVKELKPELQPEQSPEKEQQSDRKIDFRIKPQTPEEAIQAAKSIEDELERLAEQAFAQAPLSGVAQVPDKPIEPLAANDPLIDILDEGLVKILEEKTASKITSDFVKPNLNEAVQKNLQDPKLESKQELVSEPEDKMPSKQESDSDEDQPPTSDGFGPPPKKRKK